MRISTPVLRGATLWLLAGYFCVVALHCTAADGQLPEADVQKIKDALPEKATAKPGQPRKVLLFARCEGFRHTDGILAGNLAFELMGRKTGAFSTVVSEDMAVFTAENLAPFDAIVFNNTTTLKFEIPRIAKR